MWMGGGWTRLRIVANGIKGSEPSGAATAVLFI